MYTWWPPKQSSWINDITDDILTQLGIKQQCLDGPVSPGEYNSNY